MKIYIMCGIPGAGKSTWIKENLGDILIISRDLIRATIGLSDGPDHKVVGTKSEEATVTELQYAAFEEACNNNKSFVIDDINTGKYRPQLIKWLRERRPDAHIIGVNIKTQLDVCIERRKGQIDGMIIRRIYDNIKYIQQNEVDDIINVNYA